MCEWARGLVLRDGRRGGTWIRSSSDSAGAFIHTPPAKPRIERVGSPREESAPDTAAAASAPETAARHLRMLLNDAVMEPDTVPKKHNADHKMNCEIRGSSSAHPFCGQPILYDARSTRMAP
jgi:hypothetical protein